MSTGNMSTNRQLEWMTVLGGIMLVIIVDGQRTWIEIGPKEAMEMAQAILRDQPRDWDAEAAREE